MKKLFLLLGILSCSPLLYQPSRLVPIVERPNTIHISNLNIDSTHIEAAVQMLIDSLPNENLVCFYGTVEGTSIRTDSVGQGRVYKAWPDSALSNQVPCGPKAVGAIHSHPTQHLCQLSAQDSAWLFLHRELLFFGVFCLDRTGAAQFQDGRMVRFYY